MSGWLLRSGGLVLIMLIIPVLMGLFCTAGKKTETAGIMETWTGGFVLCLGLFQLLAVPCIFMGQSLTFLSFFYLGLLLFLSCLALVFWRKRIPVMVKGAFAALRSIHWIEILIILVVLFQMYMYVAYMHVDDDDALYVVTATTATETDTMFQINPYTGDAYKSFPARYVLSPFPIFIGVLSKLSQVHATVLAHTVLPPVLLLLAYAVLGMIGRELFSGNRRKNACFVLLAAILYMFTSTTVYTQGSFMLVRIWQGKAVLASVLLPMLLWAGMRILSGQWEKRNWILLAALMLACCMVSSMGIMLGAVMLGLVGIVLAILMKNPLLLVKIALCGIPNICFAAIYVFVL